MGDTGNGRCRTGRRDTIVRVLTFFRSNLCYHLSQTDTQRGEHMKKVFAVAALFALAALPLLVIAKRRPQTQPPLQDPEDSIAAE